MLFTALGIVAGAAKAENQIARDKTQKEILYELKKLNGEIPSPKKVVDKPRIPLRIVEKNGKPCNEWYYGVERK